MTDAQVRQSVADAAVDFWRRCAASYTYRQRRAYPESLYVPEARDGLDCSSTAILIYKEAAQPDPNSTGFNGSGYTGSLIGQGVRVDSILPGDLIFYGDPFGATGHVTTAIGGGECVSFGSTPISRRAVNYRPIVQVRRYPVLVPEPVVRHYLEERPWSAGGRGPKVIGPWWLEEDAERSRAARDAVLDRMRERGRLAVAMAGRDGKPYIYHYRQGTHGRFPMRRGPWKEAEARARARTTLEARSGFPLRAFDGLANSYYPS